MDEAKKQCGISAVEELLQFYNIFGIVCDGTNWLSTTNQVWHYSIDGRAQLFWPLQLSVCLLHCKELTLRELVKKLDGDNSVPRGFKVAIGQQLPFNHNAIRMTNYPPAVNALHIAFFEPFTKDWSTDQKYLLIASNAAVLSKNELDQDLASCVVCKEHLLAHYISQDGWQLPLDCFACIFLLTSPKKICKSYSITQWKCMPKVSFN